MLVLLSLFWQDKSQSKITEPLEIEYCDVNIWGEVNRPGIYSVPSGTPKKEVISLAGLTEKSVIWQENELITKSQTIEVYRRLDNPLLINLATLTELDELPGIGSVKAAQILEFIQINGYFTDWLQFQEVVGLSDEKVLEIMLRAIL